MNQIKLTAFTLFICFYINSNAQISFQTNLGFKAGLNDSEVSGTLANGNATGLGTTSFYAGFFAETKLGKNTFLQNEFLFSTTDDDFFLELPIHLKHDIFNKFAIFYGPRLDFATANTNDGPSYRFAAVAISAEIGAQYNLTKKLFVEMRYAKGFTKQPYSFGLNALDATKDTFRIGLGLKF